MGQGGGGLVDCWPGRRQGVVERRTAGFGGHRGSASERVGASAREKSSAAQQRRRNPGSTFKRARRALRGSRHKVHGVAGDECCGISRGESVLAELGVKVGIEPVTVQ